MRCQLCLTLLVLAVSVSRASAGKIFGDIKMDGKPVPEGVPVMITLPAAGDAAKGETKGEAKVEAGKATRADSSATDKFGAYKLNVKTEGKCTLTIVYEKQPVTLEVFSYKEPTRYDLILEKKEGKLTLRRK